MSHIPVSWWPLLVLVGVVATLLVVSRHGRLRQVFQWLPLPLWCYGLPMLLRAVGWLPTASPAYAWITDAVFPIALGLLLLGVDLLSVIRTGGHALLAMSVGAAAIVVGAPLMAWILREGLPSNAWQGVGLLAATWTGGSLNMVAVQENLEAPPEIFAPLVVVDALVAYSWMACLLSCKSFVPAFDRWLRASEQDLPLTVRAPQASAITLDGWRIGGAIILSIVLVLLCRVLARPLPLQGLVASTTGWTILLVTTTALCLSCVPPIRRLGQHGIVVGYPGFYLVLTALGAQASVSALATTPLWIVVGFGCVALHGFILLAAGRVFRVPFAILATASQANVGGVVSAPLVGAVYHQALAPVGLLLAIAGNAAGTYLGLLSAALGRLVLGP